MIKARKVLFSILAAASLSACGTLYGTPEEEIPQYREPRFQEQQAIELRVNRVDTSSEFTPSFTRPHVEHLFPVSIEKSATLWAHDRIKAADFSSPKIAEVIIKDASVTEELEEGSQLFEQDRIKYSARLVVSVKVTDPQSLAQASTEVEAWRTLTIPASTDIAGKEQYWNSMVEKLMKDFDARMTSNINQYLSPYIINQEITPAYY